MMSFFLLCPSPSDRNFRFLFVILNVDDTSYYLIDCLLFFEKVRHE